MKSAIISLGSKSSLMVAEAMKKYFDTVDILQLRSIEVKLGKEGGLFYEGEKLEDYDCVYAKGSFRYANLLRSITTMLQDKGVYLPVPSEAFTIVHNKLLTHLILEQHHIPMPRTYLSATIDAAKELLKKVNYPIVMKFPHGTQGKGVMFADSFSSASSMLDALGALNQPFIIQEYVEAGGSDIRALVVGEKVVAAMKRKAQTEEKRANLHAGGTGEAIQLDRQTINLALDVAKALQTEICGVDILQGALGSVVIEANVSPGLQGLQEVSTINISDEIAKFLHRKTDELVNKCKEKAASSVMREIAAENGDAAQEIISELTFRGDRILLPEVVNKVAQFRDRKEYAIKVKKGHIEIEEFKM